MEIENADFERISSGVKKSKDRTTEKPFRLTERDVELLKFIYEQKFATLDLLYFRFFDKRAKAVDAVPENLWVTRQRVAVLRRAGLLQSQMVYTESKAIYLLTQLGYQVLKSKRELLHYADPVQQVDFRYFEHDKRISYCRTALERSAKCYLWFPERTLRAKRRFEIDGKQFLVPSDAMPDGVFLSSKQERIAFELEFTPKKRERYAEKYRKYLGLLDTPIKRIGGDGPYGYTEALFHRVVIVACTDRIGKDLQEFFRNEAFSIMSYEKLIGGTLGVRAL